MNQFVNFLSKLKSIVFSTVGFYLIISEILEFYLKISIEYLQDPFIYRRISLIPVKKESIRNVMENQRCLAVCHLMSRQGSLRFSGAKLPIAHLIERTFMSKHQICLHHRFFSDSIIIRGLLLGTVSIYANFWKKKEVNQRYFF